MNQSVKITCLVLLLLSSVATASARGDAIVFPRPPSVEEISTLIQSPTGPGNAADHYLAAEEIYRETQLIIPKEQRKDLPPDSEIIKLMETGLKCGLCEYPYSGDLTTPLYDQRIPMMILYKSAAHTWRLEGNRLMEGGDYEQAEIEYSKALVLGLQLFEERGITIIQDMIAFVCMLEGAEGLGDLYIATGEPDKVTICADFLTERAEYMSVLPKFVNSLLRDPDNPIPKLNDNFKQVAEAYADLTYTPVKIEVILAAAEMHVVNRKNPEAVKYCRMVFDVALKDPDPRIRKAAAWGENWKIADFLDNLKFMGISLDWSWLKELISLFI